MRRCGTSGDPSSFNAASTGGQWPTARRGARHQRTLWLSLPVLAKLTPLVQAPTRGEVPQVVHGDLAGNVLFAPGLPPAIIDFSPYWRPTTYAAAIVAVDGVLWFGADTTLLRQVADEAGSSMPLVRAIIFRLIALNERSRSDRSALDELPLFLNAASAIERLHGS